jgi:hypothetical protein
MIDAIRDALYDLLHAATINGIGSPTPDVTVHTHVDQAAKPPLPYIVIEDTRGEPWDTDTSDGQDTETELLVVSNYRGSAEASYICDQLHALLHYQALTVTGATTVTMQVLAAEVRKGDDGATREGVVRVRVLVDDI